MDQGKKTQFTNTGMQKGEIVTDCIDINRIIRGHYEQLYANQSVYEMDTLLER